MSEPATSRSVTCACERKHWTIPMSPGTFQSPQKPAESTTQHFQGTCRITLSRCLSRPSPSTGPRHRSSSWNMAAPTRRSSRRGFRGGRIQERWGWSGLTRQWLSITQATKPCSNVAGGRSRTLEQVLGETVHQTSALTARSCRQVWRVKQGNQKLESGHCRSQSAQGSPEWAGL